MKQLNLVIEVAPRPAGCPRPRRLPRADLQIGQARVWVGVIYSWPVLHAHAARHRLRHRAARSR